MQAMIEFLVSVGRSGGQGKALDAISFWGLGWMRRLALRFSFVYWLIDMSLGLLGGWIPSRKSHRQPQAARDFQVDPKP